MGHRGPERGQLLTCPGGASEVGLGTNRRMGKAQSFAYFPIAIACAHSLLTLFRNP